MADFNKPTTETNYLDVLKMIRNMVASVATMFRYSGDTNIPNGAIRWSDANKRFEQYDSVASAWSPLCSTYNVDVASLQGKAAEDFANATHNHDAQYFTEAEVNNLIASCYRNNANTLPAQDATYDLGSPQQRLKDIYSITLQGVAVKAQYADLAEKYTCRDRFPVGTVMAGSNNEKWEIDICKEELSHCVYGIVSDSPAYLMNEKINGVICALKGKIPAKVIGPVRKNDALVSAGNGCLRAAKDKAEHVYRVALAMKTCDKDAERLVMVKM